MYTASTMKRAAHAAAEPESAKMLPRYITTRSMAKARPDQTRPDQTCNLEPCEARCAIQATKSNRRPSPGRTDSSAGDRHSGSNSSDSSDTTRRVSSNSSDTTTVTRHVWFAPGPLSTASSNVAGADGHPVTEGSQAVPVRRIPPTYALDLTRGHVLMLESLLGQDCVMSVTRLKRRVGLLPPIRAPRPHVTNRNAGPEQQQEEQEQRDAA